MLDDVIEALARRSSSKLDKPVLAALRLGIFQLTYLDRVPAHAAVGEAVELAKRDAPRGAGLVNAVLRRATREARPIIAKLQDSTPKQAALAHSHPEWIAQLWFDALGAPDARALMAADNEPAEAVLRANALKTTAPELLERLHLEARVDGEALILDEPFDAFSSVEWEDGLFMPQSRASMPVAHAVDPQPRERVLDLCAAPGAKTTHLSALMRDEGQVVAVEHDARRALDLVRERASGWAHRTWRSWRATRPSRRSAPGTTGSSSIRRARIWGRCASRPDARWRKGAPSKLSNWPRYRHGSSTRPWRHCGQVAALSIRPAPSARRRTSSR